MLRSLGALLLLCTMPIVDAHATGGPSAPLAWPHFVMIRGGGLEETVLLHRGTLGHSSPIDELYASLRLIPEPNDQALGDRYYEVAEFWFEPWTSLVGEDGEPLRELEFDEGTYFSRVYPAATNGPVWDPYLPRRSVNGVIDPLRDGRHDRFVGISEAGQRVLEAHGLRF